MNQLMRSINIGRTPEEKRTTAQIALGDTVAVKKLVHRWSDPPSEEPGKPRIDSASANIEAERGKHMTFVFLGNHPKDQPLAEREIEERLNKLGWFRKES